MEEVAVVLMIVVVVEHQGNGGVVSGCRWELLRIWCV